MWIWMGLSLLALAAGLRYLARLREVRRSSRVPVMVDDAALDEILRTGRLQRPDTPRPVDMRKAAEAEEEFWAQSWDEPEEHPR